MGSSGKLLSVIVVTITLLLQFSASRIFTRCEFAKALAKSSVPKDQIADWVCFVEGGEKDGINTHKYTNMDLQSHNIAYGMFTISSAWWCRDQRHQLNGCKIDCKNLLDDDITDDVECALAIVKADNNGLRTFYSWVNNCQNKNMSEFTAGCNL